MITSVELPSDLDQPSSEQTHSQFKRAPTTVPAICTTKVTFAVVSAAEL